MNKNSIKTIDYIGSMTLNHLIWLVFEKKNSSKRLSVTDKILLYFQIINILSIK